MNALALFALVYTGLSAMSQSMARHHAALVAYKVPRSLRLRVGLRAAATACLITALTAAVRHDGAGPGVLLWAGALTLAAPAVMLQLAYAPRTLRPCTVAAGAIGLLCAVAANV